MTQGGQSRYAPCVRANNALCVAGSLDNQSLQMKFNIKSKKNNADVSDLDEKQIAEFCLTLCGGGYNPRQVSKAMVLNSRIWTLPTESSLTERSYTITRTH